MTSLIIEYTADCRQYNPECRGRFQCRHRQSSIFIKLHLRGTFNALTYERDAFHRGRRRSIDLVERSRMHTIHFHPWRPVGASVVLTREARRGLRGTVTTSPITRRLTAPMAHPAPTTHCTSTQPIHTAVRFHLGILMPRSKRDNVLHFSPFYHRKSVHLCQRFATKIFQCAPTNRAAHGGSSRRRVNSTTLGDWHVAAETSDQTTRGRTRVVPDDTSRA